MTTVTATIEPMHRGKAFAYVVDGKVYGGSINYNAHKLARDLIAHGYGPDEILQTVRQDGTPSMRGRIGDWAKWTLREDGATKIGYRIQKWQPFDRDRMARRSTT